MDRNSWIWVAIRVFGIFMLVMAALALPDLMNHGFNAWLMRDASLFAGSPTEKMGNTLARASFGAAITSLFKVVFYLLVSWYLLRKGNFLFKLISHQPPPETSAPQRQEPQNSER